MNPPRSDHRRATRDATRRQRSGLDRRYLCLAAAALLALFAAGASSAADAPDTIDPKGSCVSGGCHEDLAEATHLHWPEVTEPGQCQRCHEPPGTSHEFETDDSDVGCFGCHEDLAKKMKGSRLRHEATEDGCLDCHDPHGGETEAMLEDIDGEDLSELCFTCHDEDIVAEQYKHGPAALGACNMCHDPHASNHRRLLRREGRSLCAGCHEEINESIEEAEIVHDPAEDDCTDCHNPHSGPAPKMLPASGRQLCNECHDDIVELAETASTHHDATTTKDECLNCHSPHAAAAEPNLRKPQRELCLGCHDKRVKATDGKRLLNMKKWLGDHSSWHKPVKEDGCSGCHNPHGSENFRILKKPFPPKFYASFGTKDYGLCFSCHEKTMVLLERTRTLTGFRRGDRNLHFVHVNKAKRGRTCRACHDIHASDNPFHIREHTPYGHWMMPLNYEKTETGGSCRPGCHEMKSYDRESENAANPKTRTKKARTGKNAGPEA